jgi:nitrite reductase/ring-hydroxylating ferredoxin subunit
MDEGGWTEVGRLEELPEGKAQRVDGHDVLVVRIGERVLAIGARCTHQGAPLDRGRVKTGSPTSVTCPIHGSVFQLTDGRVLRGPATAPVPVYETRVSDGTVSVRIMA